MKKRLLDFRENLSKKKKITMAIITFIVGIIVAMITMELWIKIIGPTKSFLFAILILGITFFTSFVVRFWIEDIGYKNRAEKLEKIENEAHERVKLILTNEFKTFSLKTDGDYDYFTKILVKEVPYTFKARMENDIIYYQFETKDGEIFYTGEMTGYSFFENHIKT
ncbi:MAG: hypothetical protein ACI4UE_05750 [Candidatus Scatovivens sp.]